MRNAAPTDSSTRRSSQRPDEQTSSSTANLIGSRLRYALAVRGHTQRTAIPAINAMLRARDPNSIPLNSTTLSRITTGKRPVRDFELLAIAQAIDVAPAWLLGYGLLDPVERDPQ